MTGRRLLGAALVSGFAMFAAMGMLATPVQAADIIEPIIPQVVPPPVVVPTWAGFYVGGFVSGHWGEVDVDEHTNIRDFEYDVDVDGILGGVLGGWNFHAPGSNWVFGIEADWGWGEIDGTASRRIRLLNDPIVDLRFRVDDFDIHQLGHVRGRIGWAGWNPNVLLFAAGGAAFAEGQLRFLTDVTVDGTSFRIPRFSGFDEQWHQGWTVGGGLDWKITPHLVLRAEYLFDWFPDSEDYDIDIDPPGPPFATFGAEIDHIHTVRGALIWKF